VVQNSDVERKKTALESTTCPNASCYTP